MEALEAIGSILALFVRYVFRPASRVAPLYLVAMAVISFGLYLVSSRNRSFLSWAFPAKTYLHRSHLTDIKLWLFGQLLAIVGFFKLVAITTTVAAAVTSVLGGPLAGTPKFGVVPMTILLVMTLDFAVYWVHRLHHQTPALWPFHSVHHSAEVMTPITLYRNHPVYNIISRLTKGLLAGTLQGVLLALFVADFSVATIASVNAGYFLFNIVGSNLRHTHIWLSYGRMIEHVFISPAQHQIHHSIDKRHFNKNYGEVFAIWDWMFGTLYVPPSRETISFGLADGSGNPVPQPHNGIGEALWVPMKDSWRAMSSRGRSNGEDQSTAPIAQSVGARE